MPLAHDTCDQPTVKTHADHTRHWPPGHDWPAVDPGDYGEPVVPLMGRSSAPPLTLAIGPVSVPASPEVTVVDAPSAPPILRLTAPEAPAPQQLTAPPARDAAPLLLEAVVPTADAPVVTRSRYVSHFTVQMPLSHVSSIFRPPLQSSHAS